MPETPSINKKDIAQKIGLALAERRKLRKLSVLDVSQALKIRQMYIDALDKGEWDKLPGEVYVRGFAMRYAQYLGLNGRELMAPYLEIEKQSDVSTSDNLSVSTVADNLRPSWVWIGVGILLFMGFIKFLVSDQSKKSSPVMEPAPIEKKIETVERKTVAAKHKLDVYSPTPLWLRVKTNDRTFEGFIPQESTWSLQGEGEFTVRMGHTKNVVMTFDSQAVALGENQRKVVLPNGQ